MVSDLIHRSPQDLFTDPAGAHPFWFKESSFLQPQFDCETYISDLRTFVPFETLRSELLSHLESLRRDLVDLINRDYNVFVNLSTNLVDVEASIVRMRAPLLDLRNKIFHFKSTVDASFVTLNNGLRQRAEASAARETLELLLDTFHVVSKVEKLVGELSSVPDDMSSENVSSVGSSLNSTALQYTQNGTSMRETQSMLMERISSEMNRLKFYTAHALNLPFIDNMENRIKNVRILLDERLGRCYVNSLENRDVNTICNCLRAYAAIDNTKDAEEFFRTTVVAPFIQRVFSNGSLGAGGDMSVDELELDADYRQIKQCIEEDCKFFLDLSFTENSGLHDFSFLSNSILKEVMSAIQRGKPGVFSPGRPANFLKNYKSSLSFLSYLEGYCPSRSSVAKFRAEPIYVEFLKLWNVSVYFLLRSQEISGSLDSALSAGTVTVFGSGKRISEKFILKQSIALMEGLRSSWSEDVLLISCSDRFLRLSLELISRYSSWISSGLAAKISDKTETGSTYEWAMAATPDDFISVIHDINKLEMDINGCFLQQVLHLLSFCSNEVLDLVKESILYAATSLKDLTPRVVAKIVESLVGKSVEDLRQLKGITATYRMTNKPLPVKHSPYISVVLRPLKNLLDGDRATTHLSHEVRKELLHSAASEITGHYHELASDLVNVARKTESSLQRIRQGAQRRSGANVDMVDHNLSDTDKICMQLFLDIQEYGRNLAALGIEAVRIPAFCLLWQCVAPPDRQTTINF